MFASQPAPSRLIGLALTAVIVELTLTTAYIHYSLGGTLFTLNAAGYVALALGLAVSALWRNPLVARFGWLPRVGLAGFTALTIGAYLVIGPYFGLGWVAKAIEVAILALLAVDTMRVYGSVGGFLHATVDSVPGPRRARPA